MGASRTLKKIGGRLREESRGIVESKLPDRLRVLVNRLACLEKRDEVKTVVARSKRGNAKVG